MNGALLVFLAVSQAPSELAEGLRLFEELRYEEAQPRLAAAKLDESLPATDRARAAVHLAIIQVSFGDPESARRNLRDAVSLDVGVELPIGASPALVNMLDEARAAAPLAPAPATSVSMRHLGPAPGSATPMVAVELDGAVARVVLHFRSAAAPVWASRDLDHTTAGRFEGVLPAPAEGATEYWLEALREDGSTAAASGSSALPMRFVGAAPEAEEEAWYEHWWLWAAAGVVVAGAVGTTIYLVTRDEGCDPAAGFGCLEVTYR